jgi:josephin
LTAHWQADLDAICYSLNPSTWLNPHKSWLGLGNYDVNVLTAALHTKDCDLVWFDKRKQPETIATSHVLGFILNVPNNLKLGWLQLPVQRRHWIAVKELSCPGGRDGFFNLDSKLKSLQWIGDHGQFMDFLRDELGSSDKELFLVVSRAVMESHSWRLGSP